MTLLSETHNKELWKELEDFRRTKPVLWALIRGRASPVRIGLMIGWPSSLVLSKLRQFYDYGYVVPQEDGSSWFLDKTHPDHPRFSELRDFSIKLELEVVGDFPNARLEDGYLSSPARRLIDPSELKARREVYLITKQQFTNLEVVRDTFWNLEFTTGAYQRARHTSRIDFAHNELKSLMSSGLVLHVSKPGRGTWWKLSSQGEQYKHEPLAQADKKTILDGVERPRGAFTSAEEKMLGLMASLAGGMTTQQLAEAREITRSAAHKQLARMLEKKLVTREQLPDGSNRWTLASSS